MARKKETPITEQPQEKKITNKDKIKTIIKKPPKTKFLTKSQEEYWKVLEENEITFCTGPAGSGKSFIALKKAVDLIFADNQFEKIIIVRPAVEVGRSLGSTPGNLEEKLFPYISSTYYILDKIVGKETSKILREEKIIEPLSLSHIRGWSIDNTILICEESQNLLKEELKALITRIGFNSKFFIAGDVEQTDVVRDITKSGLYDAVNRFKDMPKIGMFKFGLDDVVRNPIISQILRRYDD